MQFEFPFFFAFGAMLCWGLADFFIQRSTRKIGNIQSLAYITGFSTIGLLPFVLPELHKVFQPENFALLFFTGLAGFVVGVFNLEALKRGKLSVIDVVLTIEMPITILLAIFILRESFSLVQAGLAALILIGVVLISLDNFQSLKKMFTLEQGVLFALAGGAGLGVVDFLVAVSSKSVSPMLAIWLPWLIIFALSMGVIAKREGFSKLVQNGLKFKGVVFAMAAVDTIAWVFYAMAFEKNKVGITTALTEAYPVVCLFLGVYYNKEKIRLHQVVGSALAIGGVILLALTA